MRWINANKKDPPKGDLYFVKLKMRDSKEPWFPAAVNFYAGMWEVDTDYYEVSHWLDEKAPDPKISELEKRLKELSDTTNDLME